MGEVLRGDHAALESLYERYGGLLYSVALRITGDSGTAEELLQDTFFQLWRKASKFDEAKGSLIGWLLTITRHRALSRIRQKGGRFCCESLCEATLLSQNVGPTVLERQIARELVGAALTGLPAAQLEAITLAYFNGLTCEEIASRTNAPLGTVKTRLRAALKTMKKTLSDPDLAPPSGSEPYPLTLEDILITEQLLSRRRKQRRLDKEAECLHRLADALAVSPENLIDTFLKIPLELCGAGTSGLSLLETNGSGEQVFRWTNLAGKLANCVGGTTPRNFSPCGVTLDRNAPQLFEYPGRYFKYFNQVEVPIVEGLVIPFHVGKITEGTVWIVSHSKECRFDAEDVRIMTTLTEFAGCALHLIKSSDLTQGDNQSKIDK
jgi:RNA polymerase sigma factor (sigma-70 family)